VLGRRLRRIVVAFVIAGFALAALPVRAATSAGAGFVVSHYDLAILTGSFHNGTPWLLRFGRERALTPTPMPGIYHDEEFVCMTVGPVWRPVLTGCTTSTGEEFEPDLAGWVPQRLQLDAVVGAGHTQRHLRVDVTLSVGARRSLDGWPSPPALPPMTGVNASLVAIDRFDATVSGGFRLEGFGGWSGSRAIPFVTEDYAYAGASVSQHVSSATARPYGAK